MKRLTLEQQQEIRGGMTYWDTVIGRAVCAIFHVVAYAELQLDRVEDNNQYPEIVIVWRSSSKIRG